MILFMPYHKQSGIILFERQNVAVKMMGYKITMIECKLCIFYKTKYTKN